MESKIPDAKAESLFSVCHSFQICSMISSGGTRNYHDEHMVPWVVKGDQWVGYDDVGSLTTKVRWMTVFVRSCNFTIK